MKIDEDAALDAAGSVVVVGVETVEDANDLRRFGADSAQGNLYSEAVPAAEISKLIANPANLRRSLF